MYHIIVNPASRSGKGIKLWNEEVEPALKRGDVKYTAYFSQNAGDIAKLTRKVLSDDTQEFPVTIVVLGGDGTVNEALQGIDDPSKVILGYIPTGSSNDFARDLGISSDPLAALDAVLHTGKVQTMDLGTVYYSETEKRNFAVSCGIGYDAAICEEALHSGMKKFFNKLGLGKLTYLGIALQKLMSASKVSAKITIDDQPTVNIDNMLFAASMLHRFEGGGFMFCPDAAFNDGIIDMCVAGDVSKGLILRALPTAFKGKHYRYKGIYGYKGKKIVIETSVPLWVHTDGEVIRKSDELTITCSQNALKVIV